MDFALICSEVGDGYNVAKCWSCLMSQNLINDIAVMKLQWSRNMIDTHEIGQSINRLIIKQYDTIRKMRLTWTQKLSDHAA